MPKAIVATPVAQSQFALFTQADVKGGTFADAYRIEQVRIAVTQALNGNHAPMAEALTFAQGKDRKSTAWRAGLTAVGSVDLIPRKGALSNPENKAVKEQVESTAKDRSFQFGIAYAQSLKDQALAAKQKRLANFSQGKVESIAKPATALKAAPVQTESPDSPLDIVETMILAGTMSEDDLNRIVAAIEQVYAVNIMTMTAPKQAAQPAMH
jgi:hypothetical protein